jgi:hypothetical protein
MQKLITATSVLVLVSSLMGAALAQTPPGSKSAGDPSKTPTTGKQVPPTGAFPSARGQAGGSADPKSATAGTPGAGSMRGEHKMMGDVTKIDQSKGMLSVKTEAGELDLHFPPSALAGIKEGDRVELQFGIRPTAMTGSGGKRAGSPPVGKSPSAPAAQDVPAGKQPGQVTNPPGSGAPGSPKSP